MMPRIRRGPSRHKQQRCRRISFLAALTGLLFILPLFYLASAFLMFWNMSNKEPQQQHKHASFPADLLHSQDGALLHNIFGHRQRESVDVSVNDPRQPKYWRYDEAGMLLVDSDNSFSKTPFVARIPAQHRIPASVTNVSNYFLNPNHTFPQREYLFEYNPSIVRWPPENSNSLLPNETYFVASFRVSNQNYCFHPQDRQRMVGMLAETNTSSSKGGVLRNNNNNNRPADKDYLGLALLTQELKVLTSTIVNLKQAAGFSGAQDVRLFVLHQQLHVTSNDLIAPLWLQMTTHDAVRNSNATQTDEDLRQKASILPSVFRPLRNHTLSLSSPSSPQLQVWVGQHPACAGCGRPRVCGKNYNYFVDSGEARVEIWPSPPHLVQTVNLSQPCVRSAPPSHSFASQASPVRTFRTTDGQLFPTVNHTDNRGKFTRGRGGACCLPMKHPTTQQPLWVGLQHSKTPSQQTRRRTTTLQANHYLSSWYAFDTTPPYALVAQSGYFCLPFATNKDPAAASVIAATSWRTLALQHESFDMCPRIHFVSGLVSDGRGNVVVAYGVNDCYSHIVKIPEDRVLQFLFTNDTLGVGGSAKT